MVAVDAMDMTALSAIVPDGLLERAMELVDKGSVFVLEGEPSGRLVTVVRRARGMHADSSDARKSYCVWQNTCTCPDFMRNPAMLVGTAAMVRPHHNSKAASPHLPIIP